MEMKYLHSIITAVALFAVFLLPTACDRNAHEGEFPLPEGEGGVVVGLQTEGGAELPTDNIHLFFFDADDRLAEHKYYDGPEEMVLDVIHLAAGSYTVVAVVNTGADFMPPSTRADLPSIMLSDFVEWLNTVVSDYPDLLTGIVHVETETGDIERIVITLKVGTEGVRLPVLRLRLTLPGEDMPEYKPQAKSRAAGTGYNLRCVAELYLKGTDKRVFHRPLPAAKQEDGTYLVELPAKAGNYDLHLWTDYARTDALLEDTYYHTTDLKAVTLATDPGYTANTDAKDAAYFTQADISLAETGTEREVKLQRPLAKYRLVATDVEAYRKLTEMDAEKYPPLEELTVTIAYENFFPSSFNVATGEPNNSKQDVSYICRPAKAEGFDPAEALQLGSDWVMTEEKGSFVTATVRITDKMGNTLAAVGKVEIPYQRGYFTTISGEFLTAGKSGGGIHIDTEWGGEHEVEF